jgi:hypothetical protein
MVWNVLNGADRRTGDVTVETQVIVVRYANRAYAEAIVEQLQQRGIAAIVVPSSFVSGPWDVAVPACDAVAATLLAKGQLPD